MHIVEVFVHWAKYLFKACSQTKQQNKTQTISQVLETGFTGNLRCDHDVMRLLHRKNADSDDYVTLIIIIIITIIIIIIIIIITITIINNK